ncbi:PREDICTED: 40S ribosomal protein S11-like [Elephantulus edwardii]|uniref:40S ribosomal protein S11-like n=1 Tax=Elephantulus edwardii TaxID=28737 RepID=UPI0003F0BCB8|nr:PREDICTED: 40S ribosomal protein S11-like [Elephantulus edwardii]
MQRPPFSKRPERWQTFRPSAPTRSSRPSSRTKKRVVLGETGKEKLPRYYKNIGLAFKTPKEAIEGTCIDKKCLHPRANPVWCGDKEFMLGRVEGPSSSAEITSTTSANVQIGDIVTKGVCWPLSKTVRFNVLKVTKAAGTKKQFQEF